MITTYEIHIEPPRNALIGSSGKTIRVWCDPKDIWEVCQKIEEDGMIVGSVHRFDAMDGDEAAQFLSKQNMIAKIIGPSPSFQPRKEG